eukprot:scaffold41216_cov66-Phaeocystis_antarctica.AAC.2
METALYKSCQSNNSGSSTAMISSDVRAMLGGGAGTPGGRALGSAVARISSLNAAAAAGAAGAGADASGARGLMRRA